MTHVRWIQNLGGAAAEFVELLGVFAEVGFSGVSRNDIVLTFTDVTIGDNESIFVGAGVNDGDTTGWGATDNLGNTYTIEQGPLLSDPMVVGLLAAIPSVTGTLNTITVSWTTSLADNGCKAIVAGRFRNVGSPESSTQETTTGSTYTGQEVLLQAGSAGGIGVSCFGAATAAGSVDFEPGTVVGTAGTAFGGDLSNIVIGLGYATPVTSSGILALLSGQGGRPFADVGRAYSAG